MRNKKRHVRVHIPVSGPFFARLQFGALNGTYVVGNPV